MQVQQTDISLCVVFLTFLVFMERINKSIEPYFHPTDEDRINLLQLRIQHGHDLVYTFPSLSEVRFYESHPYILFEKALYPEKIWVLPALRKTEASSKYRRVVEKGALTTMVENRHMYVFLLDGNGRVLGC